MGNGAGTVRNLCRLALLCALFALAPAPAIAQDEEIPPEAFAESVDVEVVNVEVRVSDRQGRPITGLTRDDFRLFENGERVEITYFAEIDERIPAGPAGPAEAARSEPAAPPDAPADESWAAAPAPDPRDFVIFLDLGHLTPAGMKKTFGDLRTFVDDLLRPGDRVMVVERQQNLRVRLELTDDAARVSEELAAAAEAAPQGIQHVTERRGLLRGIRQALEQEDGAGNCTPFEAQSAEQVIHQHAGWVGGQVQGTIGALTSLVRALAGLPGNKTVLYVGEGLDQRPAAEYFHMLSELCPVNRQAIQSNLLSYDLSTDFHRLAAEANSNRVTFYTLDAAGLQAGGSVEAFDQHVRLQTVDLRIAEANRQSPLYQMADETGGRAIFNTNEFEGELAEISEDVSRYYSLGFVPEHAGDGRVHALRVELDARHHDLRYRRAYRDKPRSERIVEAMLGALLFGVEENPLRVRVEAGEAVPGAEGRWEVPIRIFVPLESVVLAPGTGFSVGRLRLVLAALEPEGEWTAVRQRDLPFKLSEAEASAGVPRFYEVSMDLPAGESLVAVGVRDEQGGDASYLRLPVVVKAGEAAADG